MHIWLYHHNSRYSLYCTTGLQSSNFVEHRRRGEKKEGKRSVDLAICSVKTKVSVAETEAENWWESNLGLQSSLLSTQSSTNKRLLEITNSTHSVKNITFYFDLLLLQSIAYQGKLTCALVRSSFI